MSIIDNALRQSIKDQVKETVLWQNASPNSSFAGQTIPAEIPDDAEVYAKFAYATVNDTVMDSTPISRGKLGWAVFTARVQEDGVPTTFRERTFSISDAGVVFNPCFSKAANSTANTQTDNYVIPLIIYAKRVLGGVIRKIKILTASLVRREVLA